MALLNSTTDSFFLFGTFVLTLSFLEKVPLSDMTFIKGYGAILSIPIDILHGLAGNNPLLMIAAVLLTTFYFGKIVENIGEGYTMVAIMAFLAVIIGVGVVGG